MNNPTFTHLFNPVSRSTSEGLFKAQSVTFESLKIALQDAASADIHVEPLIVHYADDQIQPTLDYAKFAQINKSVLDHGRFSSRRKLPLIRDLLELAYGNSSAEFLIFTNIDISLLPFFYRSITDIVQSGTRSFTVTRRNIPQPQSSEYPLTALFAQVGEPHRGWDCFIFPREFVPNLILRNFCIGAPLVGLGLVANLLAEDAGFKEFRQFHITFHVGNERHWNDAINREYMNYNKTELMICLKELEDKYGIFPTGSPPQKYLSRHRNSITSTFFDWFNARIYIPARYFRR